MDGYLEADFGRQQAPGISAGSGQGSESPGSSWRSAGLLLVHIWIVKHALILQGKGRPQHAQGASISSLSLLGQSYTLALLLADATGVRSRPVGQTPSAGSGLSLLLRWHQGGKDQETLLLPVWSQAVVVCPAFLPPLPGRQKAQCPVQAGAGRLPAAASC